MTTGKNAFQKHFPLIFCCYTQNYDFLCKLQPFTTQSRLLMTLEKKAFENVSGKGETAGNQYFLLFLQCFLPIPERISIFTSILPSTNASNLDRSKNLLFGKELI